MNLFWLDNDPEKSAQYHCDKHVVKMVLETAQILCAIQWVVADRIAPYRKTHSNHPITMWARESQENYQHLIRVGLCLSQEFEFRYNKKHKSAQVIEFCKSNMLNLPSIGLTKPVQCMPEQYTDECPVKAYRKFYISEKHDFAKWEKGREEPYWWPK